MFTAAIIIAVLVVSVFIFKEPLIIAYAKRLAQPKAIDVPDDLQRVSDIEYSHVGDSKLQLDVFRLKDSSDKAMPVIIAIYGGGWFVGSKEQPPAGMNIHLLARAGYAVVLPNYRLTNIAQYPAQLDDIKACLAWVAANAEEYGFDVNRIGTWGASAGAHLAAMTATMPDSSLEGDAGSVLPKVRATVNYFGPSDLISWSNDNGKKGTASAYWMIKRLLGQAAHENEQAARDASPVSYVSEHSAPMLIVHSKDDPIVPYSQSVALNEAYENAGANCELVLLDGVGHGAGDVWKSEGMIERVIGFYKKHL